LSGTVGAGKSKQQYQFDFFHLFLI